MHYGFALLLGPAELDALEPVRLFRPHGQLARLRLCGERRAGDG